MEEPGRGKSRTHVASPVKAEDPQENRLSPEKKIEVVDETEDDALNNGTAKKNPKRGRHQVVVRAPSSPFQKVETRLSPNARPSQC